MKLGLMFLLVVFVLKKLGIVKRGTETMNDSERKLFINSLIGLAFLLFLVALVVVLVSQGIDYNNF